MFAYFLVRECMRVFSWVHAFKCAYVLAACVCVRECLCVFLLAHVYACVRSWVYPYMPEFHALRLAVLPSDLVAAQSNMSF